MVASPRSGSSPAGEEAAALGEAEARETDGSVEEEEGEGTPEGAIWELRKGRAEGGGGTKKGQGVRC